MILSFRTDRSEQTVHTQIRLLLEEQSDQSIHCLLFHFHLFDKYPKVWPLFEFFKEEQSDQGFHCLLFHFHLFDKYPKVWPLFEF